MWFGFFVLFVCLFERRKEGGRRGRKGGNGDELDVRWWWWWGSGVRVGRRRGDIVSFGKPAMLDRKRVVVESVTRMGNRETMGWAFSRKRKRKRKK